MATAETPARWRVGPAGVLCGEEFRAVSVDDEDGDFVHWIPANTAERIVAEHNVLVDLWELTRNVGRIWRIDDATEILIPLNVVRLRRALGLEPRAEGQGA